jgi:hypothetical protein
MVWALSCPSFSYNLEGHGRVEHNYHDHADDQDPRDFLPAGLVNKLLSGIRVKEQSFPIKLHSMLEEVEKEGLASLVSWQPHGRCFVVEKPKEFVDIILPK